MINKDKVVMFADGASRGNPGKASYGVVFRNQNDVRLFQISDTIGITTNNVAEYTGLLEGLRFAKKKNIKDIHVYLDSQLVVKQVLGIYRVRDLRLKKYHSEVIDIIPFFSSFSIDHVAREENHEADLLANMALDLSK